MLKRALASASVISPPDYSRDFLLYVAGSMEMIGMVLVQEDEEFQDHVIYYLSQFPTAMCSSQDMESFILHSTCTRFSLEY